MSNLTDKQIAEVRRDLTHICEAAPDFSLDLLLVYLLVRRDGYRVDRVMGALGLTEHEVLSALDAIKAGGLLDVAVINALLDQHAAFDARPAFGGR